MKVTVFMAISFDGFIADENGAVDWLNALSQSEPGNGEDYGYSALLASVDALAMGRNTFDQVLLFEGWHYASLPVIVLSTRPPAQNIPAEARVSFASGSPGELLADWEGRGFNHIHLDGGQVVDDFLRADLIDKMVLTQVPAVLGNGIPLFQQALDMNIWSLESTTSYPNGFVQRIFIKRALPKT